MVENQVASLFALSCCMKTLSQKLKKSKLRKVDILQKLYCVPSMSGFPNPSKKEEHKRLEQTAHTNYPHLDLECERVYSLRILETLKEMHYP